MLVDMNAVDEGDDDDDDDDDNGATAPTTSPTLLAAAADVDVEDEAEAAAAAANTPLFVGICMEVRATLCLVVSKDSRLLMALYCC